MGDYGIDPRDLEQSARGIQALATLADVFDEADASAGAWRSLARLVWGFGGGLVLMAGGPHTAPPAEAPGSGDGDELPGVLASDDERVVRPNADTPGPGLGVDELDDPAASVDRLSDPRGQRLDIGVDGELPGPPLHGYATVAHENSSVFGSSDALTSGVGTNAEAGPRREKGPSSPCRAAVTSGDAAPRPCGCLA